MKESIKIEKVMEAIGQAFVAEPLETISAFDEDGATYLDAESFISQTNGQVWKALDAEFLEEHHDALYFLSPRAFQACLPAYLTAAIQAFEDLDMLPDFLASVLTLSKEDAEMKVRFEKQTGGLSDAQRQAVAQALLFLERQYPPDTDNLAAKALDSYWRKCLA
jgi:hypothetical protein